MFVYAQKAVLHPMSPLYTFDQQEVSMARILQSSLVSSTIEKEIVKCNTVFVHSQFSTVFINIYAVAL
jgi:hypothetical protein